MNIWISLCCLSLLSTSSFAQLQSLQECRSIDDVNARVSCYDEIVDSQKSSQATPVTSSVPEPMPQASAPPSTAASTALKQPAVDREVQESLFGAEAELSRAVIAEELGVTQLQKINAQVEEITSTAYKQLILRLDNGHTWQQTDSKKLRITEGDQIIVRSGRLGTFFMEKSAGSRPIRVKRIL